jgi:hypothetical protein
MRSKLSQKQDLEPKKGAPESAFLI